jgi:hypothetical protein
MAVDLENRAKDAKGALVDRSGVEMGDVLATAGFCLLFWLTSAAILLWFVTGEGGKDSILLLLVWPFLVLSAVHTTSEARFLLRVHAHERSQRNRA